MTEPSTGLQSRGSLSDYLAAERTFLAWVRTGLALMGFGFVVARFGLFLQQLRIFQSNSGRLPSTGISLWFGTALIALGVAVNVFSAVEHARLVRQLDRGETGRSSPLAQNIAIALVLALVGIGMAIYLIVVPSPNNNQSDERKETSMASSPTSGISGGMSSNTNKGIVDIPSNHSVDETVQKLEAILQSKNVKLFALVDHSGEAQKAGLSMHPTKLLIFGNPKAGTPLMVAAPSVALDLPLKILVWEDDKGKVWISYNSPQYLKERHGFPEQLLANIAVVETLAAKAAE